MFRVLQESWLGEIELYEMPHLAGFYNPIGLKPAFLIPIFAEWHRGNRTLIQEVSADDRVSAFLEINVEIEFAAEIHPERTTGQSAYWAFQLEDGNLLHGTASEIAKPLSAALIAGKFDHIPWLKSEIAYFCDDEIRHIRALKGSYDNLQQYSRVSADVWRDVVVLLPILKKEIALAFPSKIGRNDPYIDLVRATALDNWLWIEIPEILVRSKDPNLEKYAKTRRFAQALGITDIRIVTTPVAIPKQMGASPYGVVFGQGSTGSKIVGNPNTPGRIQGTPIFLPGHTMRTKSSLLAQQPLFAFSILHSDESHIQPALNFASRWSQKTVKIAIVMRPVGFGTQRSDKLDVFSLERLKEQYDYVFVVGNHTLEKPLGVAPSLSASYRGITYVRNCMRAWMELSTTALYNDATKIKRSFSREGFGLIGIARKQPKGELQPAIELAVSRMLHENLPLENSNALLVVGPDGSLPDGPALFTSLFTSPHPKKHPRLAVVGRHPSKSSVVVCLSFAIQPVPASPARFADFCRKLLTMQGWTVDYNADASPGFFFGRQGRRRTIFAILTREERQFYPEQLLSEIRAQNNDLSIVLVTNFNPSPKLVKLFGVSDGIVLHYSRLREIGPKQIARGTG